MGRKFAADSTVGDGANDRLSAINSYTLDFVRYAQNRLAFANN